jgi:hypothetical protein
MQAKETGVMNAEAQDQEFEETTSVELDDDSDEVIEAASDDDGDQAGQDDELDQYSENVQRRIRKLTAQRRQAEEEAAAAVQYIRQVQAQK